jgi:hypothetical protein
VFRIVVPENVMISPVLQDYQFDLMKDYAKLDDNIVANSCAWYNMWIVEPYIQENMAYTFTLLQNNTSETLWNKCLEEYEEYAPQQQGGPLMLFLILRRIQSNSETAIEHLKKQIKSLRIRDLPGENVDTAVSLIKTTLNALQSASTPEHSYIPEDFPQTVLKVLQTTSVPKFNSAFEKEETEVRHAANKFGGRPQWPPISQILNLATNTYKDLQAEDSWNVSSQNKKRALLGSSQGDSGDKKGGQKKKFKLICWNCEKEGHSLNDCTASKDEEKIEKNKKKFRALKRKHEKKGGKSGDQPRHKTGPDGKPYVLNKKGAYVLDQKQLHAEKKKDEAKKEFEAKVDGLAKQMETGVNLASKPSPDGFQQQMQALKEAAGKLLGV